MKGCNIKHLVLGYQQPTHRKEDQQVGYLKPYKKKRQKSPLLPRKKATRTVHKRFN